MSFGRSVQGEKVTRFSSIKRGDRHVSVMADRFPEEPEIVQGPATLLPPREGLPAHMTTYGVPVYAPTLAWRYDTEYGGELEDSGFLPFTTGRPSGMAPELLARTKKTRHRLTQQDRPPRTDMGRLVHALRRIVLDGDADTNTFYSNSVAQAISSMTR